MLWNTFNFNCRHIKYPYGWHVRYAGSLQSPYEDNAKYSSLLLSPYPLNMSDYGGPKSPINLEIVWNLENADIVFNNILETNRKTFNEVQEEIIDTSLGQVHHFTFSIESYGLNIDEYLLIVEDKLCSNVETRRILIAKLYGAENNYYQKIFKKMVGNLIPDIYK